MDNPLDVTLAQLKGGNYQIIELANSVRSRIAAHMIKIHKGTTALCMTLDANNNDMYRYHLDNFLTHLRKITYFLFVNVTSAQWWADRVGKSFECLSKDILSSSEYESFMYSRNFIYSANNPLKSDEAVNRKILTATLKTNITGYTLECGHYVEIADGNYPIHADCGFCLKNEPNVKEIVSNYIVNCNACGKYPSLCHSCLGYGKVLLKADKSITQEYNNDGCFLHNGELIISIVSNYSDQDGHECASYGVISKLGKSYIFKTKFFYDEAEITYTKCLDSTMDIDSIVDSVVDTVYMRQICDIIKVPASEAYPKIYKLYKKSIMSYNIPIAAEWLNIAASFEWLSNGLFSRLPG